MIAGRPGNRSAACSRATRDASEPSKAITTGLTGSVPTSGTSRRGRGAGGGGWRCQDPPLLRLELLRAQGPRGTQAVEPLELSHPVRLAAVRDLARGFA